MVAPLHLPVAVQDAADHGHHLVSVLSLDQGVVVVQIVCKYKVEHTRAEGMLHKLFQMVLVIVFHYFKRREHIARRASFEHLLCSVLVGLVEISEQFAIVQIFALKWYTKFVKKQLNTFERSSGVLVLKMMKPLSEKNAEKLTHVSQDFLPHGIGSGFFPGVSLSSCGFGLHVFLPFWDNVLLDQFEHTCRLELLSPLPALFVTFVF